MQIRSTLFGAALALSMAVSAHAQTVVTTTWSDWSVAANPGYSSATGTGTFAADAASEFPATLSIDNTGKFYGGLYTDFYYTGAADADFQLTSALTSSDVSSIQLLIEYGGYTFTSLPALTVNGQTYAFDTEDVTPAPQIPGYDFAIDRKLYTWDISELDLALGTSYDIDWQFNAHVAFTEIATAQVVAPVPEPETYAMMAAGLGLVGVAARRRRSRGVKR